MLSGKGWPSLRMSDDWRQSNRLSRPLADRQPLPAHNATRAHLPALFPRPPQQPLTPPSQAARTTPPPGPRNPPGPPPTPAGLPKQPEDALISAVGTVATAGVLSARTAPTTAGAPGPPPLREHGRQGPGRVGGAVMRVLVVRGPVSCASSLTQDPWVRFWC